MVSDEYGEPVVLVHYHMMLRGERLDTRTDALGAIQTADRNPGMWVEAEVMQCDGSVITTVSRRVVYGSKTNALGSTLRVPLARMGS